MNRFNFSNLRTRGKYGGHINQDPTLIGLVTNVWIVFAKIDRNCLDHTCLDRNRDIDG